MKAIPQLFLYKQNRRDCLGEITAYTELTEDVRFNACSELNFTVPKKCYDTDSEQWVINPLYDKIEKHRLLKFDDDTNYFEFPKRKIGGSDFYKYKPTSELTKRRTENYESADMRFAQNPNIENFSLQDETELFDIGWGAGWELNRHRYIDDTGDDATGGLIISDTAYEYDVACPNYFPVKSTDFVAVQSGTVTTRTPKFKWRIDAYSDNVADSFLGSWHYDNIFSTHIPLSDYITGEGYLRFWVELSRSWDYRPYKDWCKIFSGERRCTQVLNQPDDGLPFQPKMKWFIIVSVEEESDGMSQSKKVTAYSYEYSLSQTTFSLSENTLPLYIPDAILDLVNSDENWIFDYAQDMLKPKYGRQLMHKGVINQLLDCLPGWTIGHVSSNLMTTYRKLGDVDNIDIYSYLMDTVQSAYNCFIVFDNDEMTISAYSLEDVNGLKSNLYLTWDSAIKSFQKSNIDASYYTALRVLAGDSQYGIGLVNPVGNSMVYNFNRLIPDLNYTLSGVPTEYQRTMAVAVQNWMQYYSRTGSGSFTQGYQDNGKAFVAANMRLIQAESQRKIAFANYGAVCDKINAANTSSSGAMDREVPISSDAIAVAPASAYGRGRFKDELYTAAKAYEGAVEEYNRAKADYDLRLRFLKSRPELFTLNYKTALKLNRGNPYTYYDREAGQARGHTLLSAVEIYELHKYIIEGVWTYEHAAFSDTYDAEDIISMLKTIFDEAKYDLSHRLAIANFDFSIDSANVMAIPEFDVENRQMYMGHQVSLNIDGEEGEDGVLHPMLLEIHMNYKDPNDFKFTFTTDTKRKPEQFRFADLYGTISQTSVTDNSFTFDT